MNKIYAEGVRGYHQVADMLPTNTKASVDQLCDSYAYYPNNELPFFIELLPYYGRGFEIVFGEVPRA